MNKSHKMDRRTFISKTTLSIGRITIGSITTPIVSKAKVNPMVKQARNLHATTDYSDNIIRNRTLMDRLQLDGLHSYLASIGVSRHQWIVDSTLAVYDGQSNGIDILEEAVKSAHAHGLEFYALIKPFEECGFRPVLPHTLPFPKGAFAFKDIRGIKPIADPFAAKNVEMCLKRRPGTYKFNGPVKAINLVKDNNKPTSIKADHLSIWTSEFNNGYVKYEGPISFRESVEWRMGFPKGKQCRILHLENLEIPKNHAHILIKCSLPTKNEEFNNTYEKIIELIGADGKLIPSTMSTGPTSLETDINRFYNSELTQNQMVRYIEMPEVKAEINNPDKMKAHYSDFYNFERYYLTKTKSLDKDGFIAVVCGKPEYLLGNLHPIYPEVREHWLTLTKYCLDSGVDGINFRVANHSQDPEYWEYGFNDPVLKVSEGRTYYPTIRKINGDAYTQFLREARELIKSRGKSMTIHIHAEMLAPDDRPRKLTYLPPNFEWQWQTWVNEIADDLEFRGVYALHPWHAKQVLESILDVTEKAGKPLCFQGDFHETTFNGPNYRVQKELDFIRDYPEVDSFCLYETASYTRLNKEGKIEGSPDIKKVVKDSVLSGM